MLIHSYKAFIFSSTIKNFLVCRWILPRFVTSFEAQSNFGILQNLAKHLQLWYFCRFWNSGLCIGQFLIGKIRLDFILFFLVFFTL